MNKIILIGLSGSGKSTFAKQLSKCLNIPIYIILINIIGNQVGLKLIH